MSTILAFNLYIIFDIPITPEVLVYHRIKCSGADNLCVQSESSSFMIFFQDSVSVIVEVAVKAKMLENEFVNSVVFSAEFRDF